VRYSVVYRIKLFLNTISYNPIEKIDISAVFNLLKKHLIRCITVVDVNSLINEFQFLKKKLNKVDKILNSRKAYLFDLEEFEYTLDIEFFSNEEAYGNYIITTALSNKKYMPEILSSIDEGYYTVDRKGKFYYIYSDFDYYLKYNSGTAYIYLDNEKIIKMVYNNGVCIKNNKSSLDIINEDDAYTVIDTNLNEEDQIIAFYDIDIIKAYKEIASCLIDIFIEETELLILIGLASMLLLQHSVLMTKAKMSYALTH